MVLDRDIFLAKNACRPFPAGILDKCSEQDIETPLAHHFPRVGLQFRAAKIGANNEKAAGAKLPPRRDGLTALTELRLPRAGRG